ncbi:MAG: hypothetical protein C4293_21230 [Nitrospiraceae bacterium]
MKQTTLRTSPLPLLVASILTAGIFILDLYAPVGVAIGMLYVAPVVLTAMWSPPTHYSLVIVVATACTILTLFRLICFPSETMAWTTLGNYVLALGALWVTVILSLLRKRMEQKIRWIDLLPRL